jgi:hypothetical protein
MHCVLVYLYTSRDSWLNSFDFDYERMVPSKFNNLYEFPRDLDMVRVTISNPITSRLTSTACWCLQCVNSAAHMLQGPYTAAGLASKDVGGDKVPHCPYRLAGVIVHSGQANGGHYYSFIRQRDGCGQNKDSDTWLRFEDTEVGRSSKLLLACLWLYYHPSCTCVADHVADHVLTTHSPCRSRLLT